VACDLTRVHRSTLLQTFLDSASRKISKLSQVLRVEHTWGLYSLTKVLTCTKPPSMFQTPADCAFFQASSGFQSTPYGFLTSISPANRDFSFFSAISPLELKVDEEFIHRDEFWIRQHVKSWSTFHVNWYLHVYMFLVLLLASWWLYAGAWLRKGSI
jgi:hypothetical protein